MSARFIFDLIIVCLLFIVRIFLPTDNGESRCKTFIGACSYTTEPTTGAMNDDLLFFFLCFNLRF